MQEQSRARRVGAAAILCALVLRLFASGLPEKLCAWLTEPETFAFLTYLETGRTVRFSPSIEAYSPDFMESPPPATETPAQSALPCFSDESLVDVYYACSKEPDIGSLLEKTLSWDLTEGGPAVLILHTHTTESYTKQDEDYQETSDYRTLDEGYNMLSIGRRVLELLAQAGITAIHDTAFHDYPSYNGSYVDARESIRAYLEEYPTIRLVLDLHRDASEGANGQLRTEAIVDGKTSAQLMLVVGTNYEGYEENLSLALKLHAQLETQAPGITRPLQLRSQRFNHDLSAGGLLVEVGGAGNTHAEALLAADQLAGAIIALAKGTEAPAEESSTESSTT